MAGFLAFVDDAVKLGIDDRRGFRAHLETLKGQEVVVTVKKRPKRQGSQQMRYLRGVVIPDIAEACGYSDPDEYQSVFEAMAWKFLRLPDGAFGEPRRRSTAKDAMTQDEMTRFLDQVITFAETSIPDCRIRRPEDVDMDRIVDPEWK